MEYFYVDGWQLLQVYRISGIFSSPSGDEKVRDVEMTMTRTPIPKEYGICFDEAKLINIPFNSVREDYKYPIMEVDPQHLNELFIRGRRLDYSHLRSINSSTCHLEMVPRWIEGPPQA